MVLEACGDPQHSNCRACMSAYVAGLVREGRVTVACPHGCKAVAAREEVKQLLTPDLIERYERFMVMRQDATLRQCPRCSALCKPRQQADGTIAAEMSCGACGMEFCYYHSNAHEGRSCQDYQREIAREERRMAEGVLRGTKPCPLCGIVTEKLSGCNHMTCGTCGGHWCWMCAQAVENVAWHFNPGNPGGCQQFLDYEGGDRLLRCLKRLMMPVVVLSLLLAIVCAPTMLVWTPLAGVLILPCGGEWDTAIGIGALLAGLPLLALQLAWLPVALLVFFLACPCGADGNVLFYLLQVPFATVIAAVESLT